MVTPLSSAPGKVRSEAIVLLAASLLLGASAPPFYRIAANLPPVQLSFLISLVGTVGSGVLLAAYPGRSPFAIYARDRGQLVIVLAWGLGSFTLLVLALSAGTHSLSASLTALIYRTWPLMLGLLAWAVLGERYGRLGWVGLGIGFASVVGAYAWGGDLLFPARDLPLVGFIFLGAFGDAAAALSTRKYWPSNPLSFLFLCNAIALACFAALGGGSVLEHLEALPGNDWFAMLFLGLAQNLGLTLLFIQSYRVVGSTAIVSLVYLASPFVTFVIDLVALREPILPQYWLIAVGVLAGAVVMWLGQSQASRLRGSSAG
ncbi:MAG: DMT family transporter [Thermoplasmata archaeon]